MPGLFCQALKSVGATVTEKQYKIVTAHELSQRNMVEEDHDFSLYLADAQSHKAMQFSVAMKANSDGC